MPDKIEFVPARYTGYGIIDLTTTGRKEWFNIDGSKRTDMSVSHGDTLMMPDYEVLGQTFLNLKGGKQLYLGAGKLVRKEDEGKSEEELKAIGYEFHEGRSDFTLVDVAAAPKSRRSKQAPEEVPTSLEVDASQVVEEVK